jgi:tetratricopeptide (TPR) repeat protein
MNRPVEGRFLTVFINFILPGQTSIRSIKTRIMAIKVRNAVLLIIPLLLSINLSGQNYDGFIKKSFGKLNKVQVFDTLVSLSEKFAEENPDTALYLGNVALFLGRSKNDNRSISLASRRIAEAYFYRNEFLNAIAYYNKSANADLLINSDTSSFFAEMLTDAAYCYQELGIYEKALELNRVSLRIQQKVGNKIEIGNNLCNIGTNYFFRAQYDKAIEYFTKTLLLDRLSGDSLAISVSLNNIGMVYSRWEKHKEALQFYLDAFRYTSSETSQAIRLSNIGMSYYHLKDYDKALEYLKKALEIDVKYNQKIKIGVRKNEIGTILAAKGQFGEAIRLNEDALKIFMETDVRDSQIITLCDMGDLYRKTGQRDKAETYYLESVKIALMDNSLHHLSRNYRNLYQLAEEKKDYKKAFEYFRLFSQANDSVFNTEKHEQIARFEILFETEKKEQENQLLMRDNELKAKKQRFALAIISGLVLILILIFYLYRGKSKNLIQSQLLFKKEQEIAKMEMENKDTENRILEDRIFAEKQINRLEREKHLAEIEHKNAELANSSICLVNKNEILGEIKDKLRTHQKSDAIHEVVQFINANTDIDQDWRKFKVTFNDVHPGFFDRLDSNYPQLTDHDVRLSAYLRINLSSREIAGLMNVSLEATNKGRQRLRKKLDLEPEADLAEFLRLV